MVLFKLLFGMYAIMESNSGFKENIPNNEENIPNIPNIRGYTPQKIKTRNIFPIIDIPVYYVEEKIDEKLNIKKPMDQYKEILFLPQPKPTDQYKDVPIINYKL